MLCLGEGQAGVIVTGYARQVLGLHVTISVFVCIGKVGTMALPLVVGKV